MTTRDPHAHPAAPGDAFDEQHLLQQSKVFCIAPWSHLHVLPTGEIFPCCMSAHDSGNAVGNLRAGDSLQTAWNSESMRLLRTRMLAEQGSRLCERCYQAESVGQETWRTSQNRAMAHHFATVRKTHPDGRLDDLNLPYLDIRFSNVCNLKCRICTPKLSSKWYTDGRALKLVSPDEPALITATPDPDDLWRELTPLIPFLERFHFAGGEPLMMDDHYRLLAMLRDRGMRDVRLSYNTNLSVVRYRQYSLLDLWKGFRHIYVQASLDGMGPRGDYMRKGQNWDTVVANRQRMIADCPQVEFCVLPTVSIMNVLHMPEFYQTLVETSFIRPGEFQLNLLFEPEHFNIRGLSPSLKRRVTHLYQSFIDGYLSRFGAELDTVRGHFNAVLQYMNAEDWNVRHRFQKRTAELDVLRKERFRDVFPELADFATPDAGLDLPWIGAQLSLGRVSDALDELNAILDAPDVTSDNGIDGAGVLATARVERAHVHAQRGDAAAALTDFLAAIELDASLANDLTEQASRDHERGDLRGALMHFMFGLPRPSDAPERPGAGGESGQHDAR